MQEGEAIIHPWINKALEKAQQKVEARNFDIRKNLLKFDDVMNDQRKAVFEQRREMMAARTSLDEIVADMRHDVVEDLVTAPHPARRLSREWDIAGLRRSVVKRVFNLDRRSLIGRRKKASPTRNCANG